ncbi:MAG: right-handed parallel beta-helix repeat-containing protein [Marinifilaceae bacterium]
MRRTIIFILGLLVYLHSSGQNRIFVTPSGAGDQSGSSWENAMTDIQTAINQMGKNGGEIWVAKGTYYPTVQYDGNNDDLRKRAFTLKKGVQLYGGFAGNENTVKERDLGSNPTILSGNIGDNSIKEDNSYHVVYIKSEKDNEIYQLDGFTITDGNNDQAFDWNGVCNTDGSGIYIYLKMESTRVILNNNIVKNNYGGKTINYYSIGRDAKLLMTNNTISDNLHSGLSYFSKGANSLFTLNQNSITNNIGRGLSYVAAGKGSHFTVMNNIISGNISSYVGAGVYCNTSGENICITMTQNLISKNTHFSNYANSSSLIGGGLFFMVNGKETGLTLINNIISDNLLKTNRDDYTFILGGGLYYSAADESSHFTMINCNVVNNQQNGIYLDHEGCVTILNSIFWGNEGEQIRGSATIKGCAIQDEYHGEGIIKLSADNYGATGPNFRDPDNGDFTLNNESVCINRGTMNTGVSDFPLKDFAGNDRIQQGRIDIGAVESSYCKKGAPVIFVKPNGTGNGESWQEAMGNIQQAIEKSFDLGGGEIWVAAGNYKPTKEYKESYPRTKSFIMKPCVKLFGGFNGTETSIDERIKDDINMDGKTDSWEFSNPTILDGDIGQTRYNNSHYVLLFDKESLPEDSTLVDGFTITNGDCGVFSIFSSSTIRNNSIVNNKKDGIYCLYSHPIITQNLIQNTWDGDGIYCSASHPNISQNLIQDNEDGIHCYNDGNPCIIHNNINKNHGTGITSCNSEPVIINNIISRNGDVSGGGIYCSSNETEISISIINNTITSNKGIGVDCDLNTNLKIVNCILWDNLQGSIKGTPAVSYSAITGGYEGVGNINLAAGNNYTSGPRFVDPENDDWQLTGTSPCINAGTPDTTGLNLPIKDIVGKHRVYKIIDIGAYESTFNNRFVDVWPTAKNEIKYGQKLSDVVLTGGQACVSGQFSFKEEDKVPVVGSELHTVVFTPEDTENYSAIEGKVEVSVAKAQLTVSVEDVQLDYGDAQPEYVLHYDGFVNGEGADVLNELPQANISGEWPLDAASYEIVISGGSDDNYNFDYNNGSLIIDKADQTISWEQVIENVKVGDQLSLEAEASTGLEVVFTTEQPELATIENNVFTAISSGEVTITARQDGSKNYKGASISKTITIDMTTGIDDLENNKDGLVVYPNPVWDQMVVKGLERGLRVVVTTIQGNVILTKIAEDGEMKINLSNCTKGIYLLKVEGRGSLRIVKM